MWHWQWPSTSKRLWAAGNARLSKSMNKQGSGRKEYQQRGLTNAVLVTVARLRFGVNVKSLGWAANGDWGRYVADKADWLGARLAGTERPLAAISKHAGGVSPE